MKQKSIYRIVTASIISLVLAACVNEDDELQGEKDILEVVPALSALADVDQLSGAHTRAVPTNYTKVDYGDIPTEYAKIKVFLVNGSDNTINDKGQFYQTISGWASTVQVDPATQYYLYGFMPAGCADATIESTDYSVGATITLSNLSAIAPSDVCVITGVLKDTFSTDDSEVGITESGFSVVPGQYGYLTSAAKEKNRVYILMDHIYSKVSVNFAVDETYGKLRSIKLKTVQIATTSGGSKVTAKIELNDNSNDAKKVTITSDGSSVGTSHTINYDEPRLLGLSEDSYQEFAQFYIPSFIAKNTFIITTTYNVYDMDDNIVRENCVATNKVTLKEPVDAAGYKYDIYMLVQPTYLYQLSDPDLDNPTIVEK